MERINDNEKMHKSGDRHIIIGLVFITLAALIFADRCDFFVFNFWDYFWQIILIAVGLVSLSKSESRLTGIILIAIGGFFIAAKVLELNYNIRHLFLPTVLAVLGLLLIFRRRGFHNHVFDGGQEINNEDFIDDVAIFGGSEQKIKSREFKGGKLTNIFGGSTFDMLDAQLAPGRNYIDVFCMFGGSKFIIPADWKVRVEVTAIFGGFSDKRKSISTSDTSFDRELVVKGLVIFGGGEIKNL